MRFRFTQRPRRLWLAAAMSGGFLLQSGSCNPNVRDAIITGLETTSLTFANTIIQALFEGLDEDGTTPPA